MQLSQFDKVAFLEGGDLSVSGAVALETTEDGREVAAGRLVHFFFLIVKDGHVLSGHSFSTAAEWSGSVTAHGLTPGPALALGLTVVAKTGDTPSLETASWAQDIEIQFLVPSDADL